MSGSNFCVGMVVLGAVELPIDVVPCNCTRVFVFSCVGVVLKLLFFSWVFTHPVFF